MRILYHHRTQGKGVEGVHIRGMVEGFRRLGHKVIVVSPPGVDPFCVVEEQGQNTRLSRLWKWLGKNLPEVIFELMELSYNFWAFRRIKAIVKRERLDFLYERHALNTFTGLRISEKFNIPLILEVNDASFIERVRKLRGRKVAEKIERDVFRGAALIVTISSYFRNVIVSRGIDPDKVIVIPNAVDEKAVIDDDNDASPIRDKYSLNGQIVIGYVGAFVYWHGMDILLDSFKELVRKNNNARLLLVGDGVKFEMAKRFAEQNGLKEKIVLPGRVAHQDVFSYIQAMDICVIPDSNEYGSPMKLFEYMSMGKPVVAPRLLPIKDVLKDNQAGILFRPKDDTALTQALEILINDKDTRMRLGQAAREEIIRNHTWIKNAEKVLAKVQGDRSEFDSGTGLSLRLEPPLTLQSRLAYKWLPESCERILEIGCSSGYFTKFLIKKAKEVYGVDINGEHIKIAKKKYPAAVFQAADAKDLPFENEKFDTVVMLEVYEHVEDKDRVIKEIYRVLKPQGALILSTPNTGLFGFLDPFNLKLEFKKMFPKLTEILSTKIQRFKNTQYRDNLKWHSHCSLDSLKEAFNGKLVIERVHRGGLIIFPLCSILQSILIRIVPSRLLFATLEKIKDIEGSISFGSSAYNIVIQLRKI